MAKRRAAHAGSWYLADGNALSKELEGWLKAAGWAGRSSSRGQPVLGNVKAIISPHAGYHYCGACAAHAYGKINPEGIKRVFILGPSHHVRLSGCAVSGCSKYSTPIYDLEIDRDVNQELMATGEFEVMTIDTDEDEHSIEMQLPYVAKVMQEYSGQFKIVPILVGSLGPEKEAKYGKILAKYLADPANLFVISSDFCHWGHRFRYTEYDRSKGEIHQFIRSLDEESMDIIESMDHAAFTTYLKRTGNTICGRHPIGVFLGALNAWKHKGTNGYSLRLKFLNYDQSSACKSMRDSSVSYAAAVFTYG